MRCRRALEPVAALERTLRAAVRLCSILGVPVSAPVSQIKQTYYKTIRDCHPDITGEADDQATEFCVFLNEIYEARLLSACLAGWLCCLLPACLNSHLHADPERPREADGLRHTDGLPRRLRQPVQGKGHPAGPGTPGSSSCAARPQQLSYSALYRCLWTSGPASAARTARRCATRRSPSRTTSAEHVW